MTMYADEAAEAPIINDLALQELDAPLELGDFRLTFYVPIPAVPTDASEDVRTAFKNTLNMAEQFFTGRELPLYITQVLGVFRPLTDEPLVSNMREQTYVYQTFAQMPPDKIGEYAMSLGRSLKAAWSADAIAMTVDQTNWGVL